MTRNEKNWIYLLGGHEGLSRFLFEAALSENDPEKEERRYGIGSDDDPLWGNGNKPPKTVQKIYVSTSPPDDMDIAERHFGFNPDGPDLWDRNVLDRLMAYPDGRTFLRNFPSHVLEELGLN